MKDSIKGFKAPITETLVVILVIMIAAVPITRMFAKARTDVVYAEQLSSAVAYCRSAAEYFKVKVTLPPEYAKMADSDNEFVFDDGSLKVVAEVNKNEVFLTCYDKKSEELYSLRAAALSVDNQ